jgi:hypothetical protein
MNFTLVDISKNETNLLIQLNVIHWWYDQIIYIFQSQQIGYANLLRKIDGKTDNNIRIISAKKILITL